VGSEVAAAAGGAEPAAAALPVGAGGFADGLAVSLSGVPALSAAGAEGVVATVVVAGTVVAAGSISLRGLA